MTLWVHRLGNSEADKRAKKMIKLYMELWRIYYAIIIGGSGFTIAFLMRGNLFLAIVIVLLTLGALALLMFRTFRPAKHRSRKRLQM